MLDLQLSWEKHTETNESLFMNYEIKNNKYKFLIIMMIYKFLQF